MSRHAEQTFLDAKISYLYACPLKTGLGLEETQLGPEQKTAGIVSHCFITKQINSVDLCYFLQSTSVVFNSI